MDVFVDRCWVATRPTVLHQDLPETDILRQHLPESETGRPSTLDKSPPVITRLTEIPAPVI